MDRAASECGDLAEWHTLDIGRAGSRDPALRRVWGPEVARRRDCAPISYPTGWGRGPQLDFIFGSHNRYRGEIGSKQTDTANRGRDVVTAEGRDPPPRQLDHEHEGEHRRIHELPGRVHLDRRDGADPAAP